MRGRGGGWGGGSNTEGTRAGVMFISAQFPALPDFSVHEQDPPSLRSLTRLSLTHTHHDGRRSTSMRHALPPASGPHPSQGSPRPQEHSEYSRRWGSRPAERRADL